MTSSVHVNEIGKFDFKMAERKDGGEYVELFTFRNAGKNVFGSTPWWQEITFGSPEGLDDLIEALVYVRMRARDSYRTPLDDVECIITATAHANNDFKAKAVDGGWKCDACGEVITTKYGRPRACPSCGACFDEYESQEVQA